LPSSVHARAVEVTVASLPDSGYRTQ
jgi:hypothetical protein